MDIEKAETFDRWCNQYDICKGCPLVGQCVSPLANADQKAWSDWIDSMYLKIKAIEQPTGGNEATSQTLMKQG